MSQGYESIGPNAPTGPFNRNFEAMGLRGFTQHGAGVLSGCVLDFTPATLELTVSAGVIASQKAVAVGPLAFNATASTSGWVWIDEDSSHTFSVTYVNPGGTYVCVGYYDAGLTAITDVLPLGRVVLDRWVNDQYLIGDTVTVNDSIGISTTLHVAAAGKLAGARLELPTQGAVPTTVPGAALVFGRDDPQTGLVELHVKDESGNYFPMTKNGRNRPFNQEVLTATRQLTKTDVEDQWFKTNGANEIVNLPDDADWHAGMRFNIRNYGRAGVGAENHSISVKSFGGTLIIVLNPGDSTVMESAIDAGTGAHKHPTTGTAVAIAT